MTREEFRDYVDFLRSQDEISYDVYSGLIDGIDTLEQQPCEDWRKISVYKVETDEKVAQDIKKLLELNNQPLITSVLPTEPKVEANGVNEIINKIRAEINKLTVYYTTKDKGINLISQNAVNRIFDKYKKTEDKE